MMRTCLAIATCVALVAACGGGNEDAPPAASAMTSDLPNVATRDPDAATGLATSIASTTNETGEPLRTGTDALASSETAEPR